MAKTTSNDPVIKVRLLKPALGRPAGKTVSATQAEIDAAGLVAGSDYRTIGTWPAKHKKQSELADLVTDRQVKGEDTTTK